MSDRETPDERALELMDAEEVRVTAETDDEDAAVSWRNGAAWSTYTPALDNPADYLGDVEDVLELFLMERVPMILIRSSLVRAYPDFDLDAWFRWRTMPNEAELRATDRAERQRRMQEFRDAHRRPDEQGGQDYSL